MVYGQKSFWVSVDKCPAKVENSDLNESWAEGAVVCYYSFINAKKVD